MFSKIAMAVGIAGLFLVIFSLLVTLPVMWLWNALLPDLFGIQEIGFWQAWGLYVLASILFKAELKGSVSGSTVRS